MQAIPLPKEFAPLGHGVEPMLDPKNVGRQSSHSLRRGPTFRSLRVHGSPRRQSMSEETAPRPGLSSPSLMYVSLTVKESPPSLRGQWPLAAEPEEPSVAKEESKAGTLACQTNPSKDEEVQQEAPNFQNRSRGHAAMACHPGLPPESFAAPTAPNQLSSRT